MSKKNQAKKFISVLLAVLMMFSVCVPSILASDVDEKDTCSETGHVVVKDAAVDATCTSEGKTEGSHCSVCNKVIVAQQVVPMKNHYPVKDAAVEATCTAEGKTAGRHCYVCGAVLEAQEVVAKKDHTYISSVVRAASCTAEGIRSYVCTGCGDTHTESIAKVDHTVVTDPAVEATCTAAGKTEGSHCAVCKAVIVAQEKVPALPHDYVVISAKEATCARGEVVSKCTICGTVFTRYIPAKDEHIKEIIPAVEATCIETGLTEGERCSVCGEILKEQKETPKQHLHDSPKVIKEATCTSEGIMQYTCSVCNLKFTETIEMAAHTVVIDPAVEATCSSYGKTEGAHCSVCERVLKLQERVPMIDHHTPVTDPAVPEECITEGSHCAVCGQVFVAQQKAHKYKIIATVESTCTEKGLRTYKCEVCDEEYTEEIGKAAHTVVVIPEIPATCTAAGITEGKYCSVCGDVLKVQKPIPMIAHKYISEVITPATCTEQGLMHYECVSCDISGERVLEVIPHVDDNEDYICDVCEEHFDFSEKCTHPCHSTGVIGLIYKVLCLFWKLTKTNQTCICGAAHY